jgi:CoA:oxalate CoA-transferase
VRVALLDAIVAFQAPPLTEYLMTGQLPQRLGNQHPLICPSGVVRARDGLLTLTVFDHQWAMFCAGLGHPQWADDERFASSASRQRHRDALNELMAPVFLSRGKEEWLALLRTLDVLSAPINDYPGLLADPQVRHSGLIGRALGADGTSYPSIRNPVRMSAAEPRRDVAAPRLGEHTREILRGECGFTDAEVEDLLARGAAQAPEITQPAGEFQ